MRLFLGLAACLLLSGLSKAEVVYNNLNTGTPSTSKAFDGSNPPTSGWRIFGQKFNLSNSTNSLDYISLNLFRTASVSGNFSVAIYDSNNNLNPGDPGSSVASLASNVAINTLGSTTDSTWSLGGGISLGSTLAAGNYWVVVTADGNYANFKWAEGPNTSLGSAGTNNGLAWTANSGFNGFGGQISVPEPCTLLLGGIAAAYGGTGVWWKRRKRQPQPETTEQPAAI